MQSGTFAWKTRGLIGALAVVAALYGTGCYNARLVAAHQPYAPLLNRAGQLDIVARAGGMAQTDGSLTAQVAYSPVDQFEVLARADVDWDTPQNPTRHLGGGAAIGWYSPTDILRAEIIAGADGGSSVGDASRCATSAYTYCDTITNYALRASYVQPFVQGMVGFEIPYFELAGGLRFFGNVSWVDAIGSDGTSATSRYDRTYVEPILTLRIPFEVVRFEMLAGLPFQMLGADGPIANTSEQTTIPYVVAGFGVQLDTLGAPSP